MSERRKKRLSASEISAFCEQIALLLNGGIPIYEGTYIMYQEMEQKELRKLLKEIDTYVKENIPLYEALEKTDVFPAYMVHMVKIGETTGKLEEVMTSLAKYYEREASVKLSIKNVVFYPIMMFIMMGIILLVLVVKILPMFQNVFRELDSNISKSSSNLMWASMLVGKVVACGVFIVFAIIIALVIINKTKRGNEMVCQAGNHLPYVRRIMYRIGIGKFVSAMSLMIGSGLANEEALELVRGLIDHPTIKKRIGMCLNTVKDNGSLEDALRDNKLITGMNGRMLSVGAKTGVLDVVFEKLSQKYDQEIEHSLNGISTVIETILVISLSAIVGVVLISVMLPLVSIISSIG
ncbi:MAG: type II secretion system F family protein [bacterium]|nr:type II secretion system F family protein [bacterium]